MSIEKGPATTLPNQTAVSSGSLAARYFSAGEALAKAKVFELARLQLASSFPFRLRLANCWQQINALFKANRPKDEDNANDRPRAPQFDALLEKTKRLSVKEYEQSQKIFGIDFRPNYLSKNKKLNTEIQSYKDIARQIAAADLAIISPQWSAKNERKTNLAVRQGLLEFKPKLYEISNNYLFQISAACITNNEARFLKEWLDFHLLVGVEHFFLFNNRSSDNFLEVLKPYLEKGIVDLISWDTGDTTGDDWVYLEAEALSSALRLAYGRSKWLALIDTDEYLFPTKGESLSETLAEFEPYGAVSVRYTVFGCNSVEKIPPDKFLIETLTHSCADGSQHNNLFKSIVRPEFVDSCINSHYCELLPGFINITEDFEPLNPKNIRSVSNKKLVLNHYWSRDLDYFRTHKMPRLLEWGITEGQCMRNLAELSLVERTDILRFVPKLREYS